MRLTVLGSGNAVPTATRGCPGLLLRAAGETVLLDPGPGALAAAARHGAGPGEITAVLVSHLHLDHHLDLAALIFALHEPRFRDRPPLRVRGPRGLRRVYDCWREAYGKWMEPAGWTLDLEEVDPGPVPLAPLSLEAVSVPHGSATALGWRVREAAGGPLLAFSGDTGEGEGAVACGRDADLFVLECTLPAEEEPAKHLTAAAAGRVAASARCRRLLLVHFSERVDGSPVEEAVRAAYGGPVVLAHDGYQTGV